VKFDYTLTIADYRAAQQLHSHQKLGRRIPIIIYWVVFSVITILALVGIITDFLIGQSGRIGDHVLPNVVLICICFLTQTFRSYRIRNNFIRMFPQSETDHNGTLDIDNERILSIWPGLGEAKYYWAGIQALAQDKKITLLYLNESSFLFFPTAALSPDQRIEFNDLVARNMVRKEK
jgi:hypothetical protein